MQFTSIVAILASASVAYSAAVPAAGVWPSSGSSGSDSGSSGSSSGSSGSGASSGSSTTNSDNGNNQCSSTNKVASCCNGAAGFAAFGSACTMLSVLGGDCSSGNVQCCETNQEGFINIDLSCDSI